MSENEKRDLSPTVLPLADRAALGARASYGGYAKHKRHPHAWGLRPFRGRAPDRTFCEDTGFGIADQGRIPMLLCRGIDAGLFGDLLRQGDPTMLWTVDDNGWIYELRQTIPGRANYHGYPLLPTSPLGRKVIARFENWYLSLSRANRHAVLLTALRGAQERYR